MFFKRLGGSSRSDQSRWVAADLFPSSSAPGLALRRRAGAFLWIVPSLLHAFLTSVAERAYDARRILPSGSAKNYSRASNGYGRISS